MAKKSRRFKSLFDLADIEFETLNNDSCFPFSIEYLVLKRRNCKKEKDVMDTVSGIPRNIWLS